MNRTFSPSLYVARTVAVALIETHLSGSLLSKVKQQQISPNSNYRDDEQFGKLDLVIYLSVRAAACETASNYQLPGTINQSVRNQIGSFSVCDGFCFNQEFVFIINEH